MILDQQFCIIRCIRAACRLPPRQYGTIESETRVEELVLRFLAKRERSVEMNGRKYQFNTGEWKLVDYVLR